MTDRPVIMSAPMVQACLREISRAGTGKTETRRLEWGKWKEYPEINQRLRRPARWTRLRTGDRLWVRESLKRDRMENFLSGERDTNAESAYYMADDSECLNVDGFNIAWVWKNKALPSIHMPRWASRLTLVVESLRRERLQDITDASALAEGVVEDDGSEPGIFYVPGAGLKRHGASAAEAFRYLWEMLHGPEAWAANPDVVVVGFRPLLANIDKVPA